MPPYARLRVICTLPWAFLRSPVAIGSVLLPQGPYAHGCGQLRCQLGSRTGIFNLHYSLFEALFEALFVSAVRGAGRNTALYSGYQQRMQLSSMNRVFTRLALLLCLSATLLAPPLSAQDDAALQAMEWRAIGPFNGGRGTSVVGHPTDPMVFWFGHSSGGLWKTEDAGTYWLPVGEGQFNYASVGADRAVRERPGHHVRGPGRAQHAPERQLGRRHVQVHRRRRDLGAHRPGDAETDCADSHSPGQPGYRLRGHAGPRLRSQRGPRCVQDHRWRQELDQRCCTRTRAPAPSTW